MKQKSFTLIEILVVVTIIALITSIAAVTYTQLGKQSRDSRRKADIEQIRAALEMYRADNSTYAVISYTGNCTGFNGLTGSPKYIETMPSDPKSSFNYYCEIITNDYLIGAKLEITGGNTCGSCASGVACDYCLGPYGVK